MSDVGTIVWAKNRGRDGWSNQFEIDPDRSHESRNVHLYNGGLGTRRGGSTSVAFTGGTAPINALVEFIPSQSLAAAQLLLVDGSATTKILRSAGGTSFTNQTLKDNVATEPYTFSATTVNGKLYLAYDSTVNRLHVYDPNNASADTIRRAGLAPFAAAATVANTGAGAYAATLRYYKVRSTEQQSSLTIRRSEANASVSFTPSGAGTAARITRPTAVSEGETHWEVYGSTDNVTFYGPIGTIAIGTTTYDDSSTPSTWPTTYEAEPLAGTYTPFPSVKCLGSTGTRLYGFGVWETSAGDSMAPKNGRFYFGPVLDSTSTHDDERINNSVDLSGFIDVARNSGAVDRGCTPQPLNNVIYCFQSTGVYGLIPTESTSDETPFRRVVFSTSVGNIGQQAIVTAVDRLGRPCVYFMDPIFGPYMIGGPDGFRWCGKDVADLWAAATKDSALVVACGDWYAERSQVIFLITSGGSTTPNLALVLDPSEMYVDDEGDLRGGWVTYDGDYCSARCIRTFSNTLAATRSSSRVPYTGGTKLLRYDEGVLSDDGTALIAAVSSPTFALGHRSVNLRTAYVLIEAQGITIQHSLYKDIAVAATSVATEVVGGTSTVSLVKFGDATMSDAWGFYIILGDPSAVNVVWQLHQYRVIVEYGAAF